MKLENVVGRSIEILLRMFGIWPETSCVVLRRLFWTVALVIEQVCLLQYIVVNFYSVRFDEIMNALSVLLPYLILLIKLGIFWHKQRTFRKILTMMAIDWERCSNEEFSMLTTTGNARLSRRFANMTVVLYTTAVILYSSNSIAGVRTDGDRASNTSARPLILQIELPFDYNRRFVYELVVIAQFFHLLLCSCAIGIFNVLLINLILHVGGQIDILRRWLTNIFAKKEEKKSGLNRVTIGKVITKHQTIIVFSEYIECLYSDIVMALFVSDTLTICCLAFILVTSIGSPDALQIIGKTLVFYLVMNMEAFTFCFAGEYLSTKSKMIGDAAYDSLWYESDSKDNRIILLLIMRSQNQLSITIGKTMDLSLARFTSIIKASASYVSVLLAMY